MADDKKWTLLARYLSGECDESEKRRVETWLDEDRANRELLESMKRVWEHPEPQSEPSDVSRLWQEVAQRGGIEADAAGRKEATVHPWSPQRAFLSSPLWRMAAILIVAAGLLYYFTQDSSILPWGQGLKTITVDFGARENISLSDGSKVALDAGTRLSYSTNPSAKNREVHLQGEAYFEVEADPQKPFIIHANHSVIQVLGTKFNVRAWPEDKKVIVSVLEGRVTLRQDGADDSVVILEAGQKSTLLATGRPSEPISIDFANQVGWMNNSMQFEDAALDEILRQLQRWYNIQFEIRGSFSTEERLTLRLNNQSIPSIMDLISFLTDLEYKQVDNVIILQPKVL